MSFMTQNKALELVQLYIEAEQNGEDSKAIAIEKQLNDANWKIVSDGKGGLTVDKQGGWFSGFANTDQTTLLPKNNFTASYRGTNATTTNRTGLWIAVTIGGILLIVAIAFAIRAHNKRKANVKSTKAIPKGA